MIETQTGENVSVRVRGTGRQHGHVEAGVNQKGIRVTMMKERSCDRDLRERERNRELR